MSQIDDEKIEKVIEKVMKVLNKNNLTIPELIITYGNLGYHIGAAMAGFKGTGPGVDELEKEYYQSPTVDVGLMLQGLLITDWTEDFLEKPVLSNLSRKKEKKDDEN